jgi:hypothetical protein
MVHGRRPEVRCVFAPRVRFVRRTRDNKHRRTTGSDQDGNPDQSGHFRLPRLLGLLGLLGLLDLLDLLGLLDLLDLLGLLGLLDLLDLLGFLTPVRAGADFFDAGCFAGDFRTWGFLT